MIPPTPRFPIYIPSKSRAQIATTPRVLDALGVPYRLVVEDSQHDEYAALYGDDRVLVLDPAYRATYDTCLPDFDPTTMSYGSGPAQDSWNLLGWVRPDEHPDGLLTKPCDVCGFRYGTAWLTEDVPASVIAFLDSLPVATDTHPWGHQA